MKLSRAVVGLLLMSLAFLLASQAIAQDIAVVVRTDNNVSSLSTGELRKLFAGEKRTWPGGQAVKLIVRAPGTPERAALLNLLKMSESEYKKYWTSQVFKGEAQNEPVVLPSNGMQKEAVQAFPGAIVLMALPDVQKGMKVLKVDGHMPGEDAYPLR